MQRVLVASIHCSRNSLTGCRWWDGISQESMALWSWSQCYESYFSMALGTLALLPLAAFQNIHLHLNLCWVWFFLLVLVVFFSLGGFWFLVGFCCWWCWWGLFVCLVLFGFCFFFLSSAQIEDYVTTADILILWTGIFERAWVHKLLRLNFDLTVFQSTARAHLNRAPTCNFHSLVGSRVLSSSNST